VIAALNTQPVQVAMPVARLEAVPDAALGDVVSGSPRAAVRPPACWLWRDGARGGGAPPSDSTLSHQDVIGIDEGSFFPDIVSFCEVQANRGKVVIVASLDGTFQRKEFGQILQVRAG
jgi:hypothetical protein